MPNLTKTALIAEAIQAYNEKVLADAGAADKPLATDTAFLSHRALGRIAVALGVVDKRYTFANLLVGTEVYIPPKPAKKADPEYDARMKMLRARLEEQEYQSMIVDSIPEGTTGFMETFDTKELKQQLSVIVNVLFSVVSVAFAVWTWGGANLSTGKRLLLSMFAGAVVLIAEVTLYIGYVQRIQDAKIEEMRRTEVKEVIHVTSFAPATKGLLAEVDKKDE
ncbi:endoplasmic reticulum-based factor for assembly of V-ATPase-domain-containing protein [Limtongia smithiae]|uniref:endoplasmic reticulum-based factor for assembly of V-ATPase-domain-containing protein n=1 Tax=Limtongia smithiae TaxID=1125753 RepID=UPI0034CF350B